MAVKAGVVLSPVRKLYVDGRISCLHQHQVQNQPLRAAIAVNERMDSLETQVEQRRRFYDMPVVFG